MFPMQFLNPQGRCRTRRLNEAMFRIEDESSAPCGAAKKTAGTGPAD